MTHIEPLDHRDLAVATQIYAVVMLAHAQEAELLGVQPIASLDRTPDVIQASNEYYLGAFHDEELLGTLSIGPDDEPRQINIASLAVSPDHQRQGIARSLITEALRRGEGMIFSVSTAAKNIPALALYQSLGFVEYRRGSMGPEEVELVKLRTVRA